MMNESIHSLFDGDNQLILPVGDKHSKIKLVNVTLWDKCVLNIFIRLLLPRFTSFQVALSGIMEAIEKLSSPEHGINKTGIVIGILIFGMLLESLSLRVAFKEIKELNTDELPL